VHELQQLKIKQNQPFLKWLKIVTKSDSGLFMGLNRLFGSWISYLRHVNWISEFPSPSADFLKMLQNHHFRQ